MEQEKNQMLIFQINDQLSQVDEVKVINKS